MLSAGASGVCAKDGYKKEPGPYRTASIEKLVLKDKEQRTLQVTVRAPMVSGTDSKAFPLVIFSHGAGGDSGAFPDLCSHWASYGYVVVNPTHPDSVKLRLKQGEAFNPLDIGLRQQVVGRVSLRERHADVRQILDSVKDIDAALSGKTGAKIDGKAIALAGHSAGAMTTQTLAGAKMQAGLGGRMVGTSEPRIKAFIVISGQGADSYRFNKDSWKEITSPMLVIAGSKDTSPVEDFPPESRKHPYEYARPGDKYLVYIEGATHGSYAGKSTSRILGESPPKNIDYITDVTGFATLAFLDRYLKDEKGAKDYLESDALEGYPGGKLDYSRK